MTTRAKVWTGLAIFAAAVGVYYPFSPAGRQGRNMAKAAEHIRTIEPRVAGDPRFRDVRLRPFTGKGGSLGVFGTVATAADREALRAIIDASSPTTPVAFSVVVPATQPTR